ncbi:3-dehydroquinate synthase [Longirhabdus pacifica]|uniref:3-dehydroquinate synthase n=1 Tax=Longirhabdus pacifica TaxID=2305227 RepID=UPI00100910FF|nr:3-dehydroquinate synthase [Longirhabdus pacifica]
MKLLNVDLGDRSYPIYIEEGLLQKVPALLQEHHITQRSTLVIVTDDNVAPHYLHSLVQTLHEADYNVVTHIIPAGEASKSLHHFESIMTTMIEHGCDRNTTVLALGGGVVGDIAGFAAASFMRGVSFVQLPTTILAHDSSVGGKVAVNHPLAKNMIGAFHQPKLVIYDLATLKTLPQREVKAGLAEVIKEAFLWDAAFLDWCEQNTEKLLGLDYAALEYALFKGCSIKAEIVSNDEREAGIRAFLNLGHTIGHAIEAVASYGNILHGEAISIGMVGAAKISVLLGCDPTVEERMITVLEKFQLPVSLPSSIDTEEILQAMMRDKKVVDGKLVFVVLTQIGKVKLADHIDPDMVRTVINELK